MKKQNIQYLKTQFMEEWNSTRTKVFCCCGKLATGLHESNCRKFNAKVDAETAKRLEKLIMPNI